jgi:hypothetical protein
MPSGTVEELVEQTGISLEDANELMKWFPDDIVGAITLARDPFSPSNKRTNDRLLRNLRDQGYIRELLRHAPWLSEESAAKLKEKFPNSINRAISLAYQQKLQQ